MVQWYQLIIWYLFSRGKQLIFINRSLRESILASVYWSQSLWVGDRNDIRGDSDNRPEFGVLSEEPSALSGHAALVYEWEGAEFRGEGTGDVA